MCIVLVQILCFYGLPITLKHCMHHFCQCRACQGRLLQCYSKNRALKCVEFERKNRDCHCWLDFETASCLTVSVIHQVKVRIVRIPYVYSVSVSQKIEFSEGKFSLVRLCSRGLTTFGQGGNHNQLALSCKGESAVGYRKAYNTIGIMYNPFAVQMWQTSA